MSNPIETTRKRLGTREVALALALVCQAFLPRLAPAQTQYAAPHEIGVVYYANGSGFKALVKETAPQSGRSTYSAKVKGAHAAIRLVARQPQTFRVCSVDPSRYKLFTFRTTKDFRAVTIAKINIWVGGSTSKVSESEIPVTIQQGDGDCFTINPKEALRDGEYGFSPAGAEDVFMFGVGDLKPGK